MRNIFLPTPPCEIDSSRFIVIHCVCSAAQSCISERHSDRTTPHQRCRGVVKVKIPHAATVRKCTSAELRRTLHCTTHLAKCVFYVRASSFPVDFVHSSAVDANIIIYFRCAATETTFIDQWPGNWSRLAELARVFLTYKVPAHTHIHTHTASSNMNNRNEEYRTVWHLPSIWFVLYLASRCSFSSQKLNKYHIHTPLRVYATCVRILIKFIFPSRTRNSNRNNDWKYYTIYVNVNVCRITGWL